MNELVETNLETDFEPDPRTDEARWQAVLGRSAEADGSFYYAVHSTHIYCRPSCPSRRPKRENVRFFSSPEAARGAGFRACLRCRPDEVSAQERLVARVQALLETEPTPTLHQLAEEVRLSPAHLQRLFKRATGLSPKGYARARRAEKLTASLREGGTVTSALYDAGYGSSRALYSSAKEDLGMSPGAYKRGGAGERIVYGVTDSPLGRILVAATEAGVCALRFGEDEALVQELNAEFPKANLEPDLEAVRLYLEAVLGHLEGKPLDLPLDLHATDFQKRVWAALRAVPYGETRSYSDIARAVGAPEAVRAVARACAANPVALAIPCHRVVRAGGGLSGYRWGVARKGALLERERALTAVDDG